MAKWAMTSRAVGVVDCSGTDHLRLSTLLAHPRCCLHRLQNADESAVNKEHVFELSTQEATMYFVADSAKEKEEWINAVGKAIVRSSSALAEREVTDY